MPLKVYLRIGLTGFLLMLLTACQASIDRDLPTPGAVLDPSFSGRLEPLNPEYADAEASYRAGVQHYHAGDFSVAQRYFQAAVERMPGNATAWIGLAASYDRAGRFDLADYAYTEATRIAGPTAEILNNQGYSRLLRGDLSGARDNFLAAYEIEPGNAAIKNNLVLLSSSAQILQGHRLSYE